jgi:ATP-dependent Clp protease protease subunit
MNEKIKDAADQFHSDELYLPTRTLTIFGEIDEEKMQEVIKNLHVLDNHSQGLVTIMLNTEGGCVTSGMAIYNAIRCMKNYVKIICMGEVSSMGTVILQAGDSREIYEDSFLMLHEGEGGAKGRRGDRRAWTSLHEAQHKRTMEIYLKKIKQVKPRYTMAKLEKEILWDRIFTADEAVEWGLVDKVIKESY